MPRAETLPAAPTGLRITCRFSDHGSLIGPTAQGVVPTAGRCRVGGSTTQGSTPSPVRRRWGRPHRRALHARCSVRFPIDETIDAVDHDLTGHDPAAFWYHAASGVDRRQPHGADPVPGRRRLVTSNHVVRVSSPDLHRPDALPDRHHHDLEGTDHGPTESEGLTTDGEHLRGAGALPLLRRPTPHRRARSCLIHLRHGIHRRCRATRIRHPRRDSRQGNGLHSGFAGHDDGVGVEGDRWSTRVRHLRSGSGQQPTGHATRNHVEWRLHAQRHQRTGVRIRSTDGTGHHRVDQRRAERSHPRLIVSAVGRSQSPRSAC